MRTTTRRWAAPAGWAPGLVLAAAAVLGALTGLPGAHARWAQAEPLHAGTVATGQVAVTADGAPTFQIAGVDIDPATRQVCVGEVVRVSLPVQVLATGTSMAPVLSRSTVGQVPGHVSVTEVNLGAINTGLAPSPDPQQLVVQVDVTSTGVGLVDLGHDLTLTARPGSAWDSTHRFATSSAGAALQFVDCSPKLVTTWDTTLAGVGQPHASMTFGGGASGRVDWGDGSLAIRLGDGTYTHTYAVPGTYTVTVTGEFGSITFDGSDALSSVDRWDQGTGTRSIASAFAAADNIRTAVSPPSTVTTMAGAFEGSPANPDLIAWDTSNVTDMSAMFRNASAFNGDVSAWDTSRVTLMSRMFSGAAAFDGDVSAWDTSKVTSMRSVFYGATAFNGDLSGWNTENVTDMYAMFYTAVAFEGGDLSAWDTALVTDMGFMFDRASAFNSNLSGWRTGNVTSMTQMFLGASSFTGDLRGWNVARIPVEPDGFRTGANAAMQSPVWGTVGSGAVRALAALEVHAGAELDVDADAQVDAEVDADAQVDAGVGVGTDAGVGGDVVDPAAGDQGEQPAEPETPGVGGLEPGLCPANRSVTSEAGCADAA